MVSWVSSLRCRLVYGEGLLISFFHASNFINSQLYQPYLDPQVIAPHRAVKSIFNVTRERGWRPIWEKDLGNVKHAYISGKVDAGFHEDKPLHEYVSLNSSVHVLNVP